MAPILQQTWETIQAVRQKVDLSAFLGIKLQQRPGIESRLETALGYNRSYKNWKFSVLMKAGRVCLISELRALWRVCF